MTLPVYNILIHQHGVIIEDGKFDADDAEEVIARSSPENFLPPKRIILLAILNRGSLNIGDWHISIQRFYGDDAEKPAAG